MKTRAIVSMMFLAVPATGNAFLAAQTPPEAPRVDAPAPLRRSLPIAEVVVYEDRALVTREGDVPLQGTGAVETVFIGGLPPALSETSLRAGLADPSKGRVVSVSSQVERHIEIQDAKLRSVDEERRAAARNYQELSDEITRIATREAYVEAYEKLVRKAVSERTGGGADPATDQWAGALKFLRDQKSSALTARREVERKQSDVVRAFDDLDAEVERLHQPADRSERTAEVSIEGAPAGSVRVRVSYVIPGAGWIPRYDARFDSTKGELAVTYFGEIRQRTGEDWKDAKLVLSTARPSVGARRPEIVPVRIGAFDTPAGAKGKIVEEVVRAESRDVGIGGVPAVETLDAMSKENATSATFSVPGVGSIPSDGRPHKVPVVSFRERSATSFETAPRLEKFVYLKCASPNGSPYPMLAGPIDIFRGSGFIGTSRLKFTAPGRPFEISLGIEESLKVRRAVTANAWTGRGKEKRHGFDVEVANFGEKSQKVAVLESYPVSDIEEVKVTLDDSTTTPSEKNEKDGSIEWRVDVPPGEARTVHLEYTVRYPNDYTGEG